MRRRRTAAASASTAGKGESDRAELSWMMDRGDREGGVGRRWCPLRHARVMRSQGLELLTERDSDKTMCSRWERDGEAFFLSILCFRKDWGTRTTSSGRLRPAKTTRKDGEIVRTDARFPATPRPLRAKWTYRLKEHPLPLAHFSCPNNPSFRAAQTDAGIVPRTLRHSTVTGARTVA